MWLLAIVQLVVVLSPGVGRLGGGAACGHVPASSASCVTLSRASRSTCFGRCFAGMGSKPTARRRLVCAGGRVVMPAKRLQIRRSGADFVYSHSFVALRFSCRRNRQKEDLVLSVADHPSSVTTQCTA
jgi:hypothetical protein